MSRRLRIGLGVILLVGLLPAWGVAKTMSVQVRNGQVRGTPSFLGKVVGPVTYGDQLEVLAEQGPWIQVRLSGGQSGWIHQSALSEKKIAMRAGQETVATGASGDELALAGKGFSADVEAAFKAQNKNVDFTWVDRMEQMTVSPAAALEFLREGHVSARGGQQ